VRANRAVPKLDSSAATRRLTWEVETPSLRAAAENPWVSATAMNSAMPSKVIIIAPEQ